MSKLFFELGLILGLFLFLGCSGGSDQNETPGPNAPTTARSLLPEGTPESQGISGARLNTLDGELRQGKYGEVHSLLIVRRGTRVFERYYRDWQPEALHRVYSVSKSVASLGLGLALDEGVIQSLDQKLLAFFPEYGQLANPHPWKSEIDLQDLLTMRAGFSWDESSNYNTNPDNDANLLAQNTQDWVKYMLDRPMADQPGTNYVYNSGATLLFSAALEKQLNGSLESYLRNKLFAPLGITSFSWDKGPRQITNAGWGLWLRPVDMATLGVLLAERGNFRGVRVLPESWIEASKPPLVEQNENLGNFTYGYQWWGVDDDTNLAHSLGENDLFFAWGFGGQFIFVVPHLELVVVMTGGNFENSVQQILVLADHVLPALSRAP